VPALLEAARDSDAEVRLQAIQALGALGAAPELPAMINLILSPRDPADRNPLQQATLALLPKTKTAQPTLLLSGLTSADDDAKPHFIALLPALGDPTPWQQLEPT